MNRLFLLFACSWIALLGCRPQEPVLGQMRHVPSDTSWEVLAVHYGTFNSVPVRRFVRDARQDEQVRPLLMTWVIRGHERVIVVDPGFSDAPTAQRLEATVAIDPAQALAEFGIDANKVTDVFVSSFRSKQINTVDRYPNARIFMQAGAYNHARSYIFRNDFARRGINPAAIQALEQADAEGRLVLMDTTTEVEPGIQMHAHWMTARWDGYYAVRTAAGVIVLGNDIVPLAENLQRSSPPPNVNVQDWAETLETMRILTADGGQILPGLDPAVFENAQAVSERVHRIAAQ